jgi:hypothetical protein
MAGPKTPNDARKWAREAIENGRFIPSVHFRKRLAERRVTMNDIYAVFSRRGRVEPYAEMPKNGGTCWRFFGLNIDGDAEIAVGIEAFHDGDSQERIILCTVLPPKEKS